MSSTAMLACICQIQESCGRNENALPRPYRWKASMGRSARASSVPLSRMVAPGLTESMRLTAVMPGSVVQRSADAASFAASCVTAVALPARVGFTFRRDTVSLGWRRVRSRTTGRTSATAVPA